MSDWAKAGLKASVSGTIASILTTAALAALSRTQGNGALQPTNSTSHWLRGERAGRVKRFDTDHTVTGYATHHASAVFWALPFEYLLEKYPPRTPGGLLAQAAGMSAVAAVVDYGFTPKRYTPGWEEVLPTKSIVATYGVMALGLAAGALVTRGMPGAGDAGARSKGANGQRNLRAGRAASGHNHRAHTGAEKLYALIDDIRVCMMTTTDDKGRLYSRPMYALAPDEAGDLWFFTKHGSPKMQELRNDSHVNLAFSHPGKQHYVSVAGRAQLVQDRAVIKEKWAEPMRTWFPEGSDDPQLALLRVHPETGEYWDSPSATVMYLYGYAKAVITGEPPTELGETAKVNLS